MNIRTNTIWNKEIIIKFRLWSEKGFGPTSFNFVAFAVKSRWFKTKTSIIMPRLIHIFLFSPISINFHNEEKSLTLKCSLKHQFAIILLKQLIALSNIAKNKILFSFPNARHQVWLVRRQQEYFRESSFSYIFFIFT